MLVRTTEACRADSLSYKTRAPHQRCSADLRRLRVESRADGSGSSVMACANGERRRETFAALTYGWVRMLVRGLKRSVKRSLPYPS
jgi:hypothetical protein